jgi:hypothetical protein
MPRGEDVCKATTWRTLLARTTLRVVTNVRELEPDVAQALACRGELQFAQRDFSPARSVTCAVVLWKAGRKAGLVETTRL